MPSWAVRSATALAAASAPAGVPSSCSLSTLWMGSTSESNARRNARAVTQNPGGTGNPAPRRVPKVAALVPTCWTSDRRTASSEMMRSGIVLASMGSP